MIRKFQLCVAPLLATALLMGCATTKIPKGRPAYVYVAENGIVSFRGDTFKAIELPERLIKAGATPETPINIIAQGEVPRAHLTELAMACGRVGLPNCIIREKLKITAQRAEEVK